MSPGPTHISCLISSLQLGSLSMSGRELGGPLGFVWAARPLAPQNPNELFFPFRI